MSEEPTIEEITERYQDANAKLHRATRLTDGVKAFELLTAVGHELIVAQQARIAELESALASIRETAADTLGDYTGVEDPYIPLDFMPMREIYDLAGETLEGQ